MKNSSIEAIGYTAGLLSVGSFVPQVYTSFTTTENKVEVNVWFVLIFIIGLIFWTIYGALLVYNDLEEDPGTKDPTGIAVLVFNAVALALNLAIFSQILRKKIYGTGIYEPVLRNSTSSRHRRPSSP